MLRAPEDVKVKRPLRILVLGAGARARAVYCRPLDGHVLLLSVGVAWRLVGASFVRSTATGHALLSVGVASRRRQF